MVAMLQIGLSCVARMPEQRPKIGEVVKMLEEIRSSNTGNSPSAGTRSPVLTRKLLVTWSGNDLALYNRICLRNWWERLVASVLRREQFRQLCRDRSRTPSAGSSSSGFSFTSPGHDADHASSSRQQGRSQALISNSIPLRKVVMKLEFTTERMKKKAMKKVNDLSGVESIASDLKEKTNFFFFLKRKEVELTVALTGYIDPMAVVGTLRKLGRAEIVSVGPAQEPKKEEAKRDKRKKDDEQMPELLKAYGVYYYPQHEPPYCYYYNFSIEEDPNACVIS
ncbi:UNVERIFIED_CONTAM: hypothetical protein Slati_4094400 [Sesamum latifolium]|uniref:Uncharacterized protein n=1 Tax=Sesamum latifolium TaxID=2727402 RepID=A0AAW2T720_9LAMI